MWSLWTLWVSFFHIKPLKGFSSADMLIITNLSPASNNRSKRFVKAKAFMRWLTFTCPCFELSSRFPVKPMIYITRTVEWMSSIKIAAKKEAKMTAAAFCSRIKILNISLDFKETKDNDDEFMFVLCFPEEWLLMESRC